MCVDQHVLKRVAMSKYPHTCKNTYIHMQLCECVCTFICEHAGVCAFIGVRLYVCVQVRLWVRVCVHV